jgi:arylsulfatase A-like enzyme
MGHAEIRGNLQAKTAFPQFPEGQYPVSEGVVTLPMVFREAGYRTGAMGKWGLGPVGSTGDPARKGIDEFFGYNCQAVAHSFYPRYLWRNDKQVEINAKPVPGHAKQPEGEVKMETWIGENYAPDLMMKEALAFLDRNAGGPFFLYLPFVEPHVAMHPPADRVNEYPAEWDDKVYRGECGYLPHPRPRAAYAAMITDLDRHVGEVMDRLDKLGLSENTIVVFSSDNGTTHEGVATSPFHIGGVDADFFHSTAGLRGFKGSVYEGGLRVPTMVRFPGHVAPGVEIKAPGYFADWFPTLCAATGLVPPEGLDGQDLWPLITGAAEGSADREKPMVWVYPEYGGQVAVNYGTKKVLRRQLATKKPGPWEVYDVVADPGEKTDLAASEADLIERTIRLLKEEVGENKVFPLSIPGVNDTSP